MQSPCYECQNRKLLCHSKCPEYHAYKEKLEIIKKRRYERIVAIDIDTRLYEKMTRRKVAEI